MPCVSLPVDFLLTYFVSASCPRGLLVMRKTWVYTRTIWTKTVLLLRKYIY